MHEISSLKFEQQEVDVRLFKNIEYDLKDGKIRKCVNLIIKSIKVHTFMDDFKTKYLPKYVKHSKNA